MEFANNDEIKYAHDVLLKEQVPFDEEKIEIIKCNESKDVKSCPGSGKTTTLLAKLVILSQRMPLADGRGICVLTHTNVAIDEIKSKLDTQANVLFNYPNFFGTIQVFVDRFLARPYYNSTNPHPLTAIDDEWAEKILENALNSKTPTELECIWHKIKDRISKSNTSQNRHEAQKNYLFKSYYEPDSKKYLDKYKGTTISANEETQTYKLFDSTRGECIKEGVLKYDDAYAYAIAYCKQCGQIKEEISERFSYLFIDEMQDTSEMQSELIDMLFDKGKVVIQRFGDPMQAIYDEENGTKWNPRAECLSMTKSMRFGPKIANLLSNICGESNDQIKGNESIDSVQPIMIVYDNPKSVLPKFVELMKERKSGQRTIYEIAKEEQEKDPLHRCKVKAIGWVADDKNDKVCISAYFEHYIKETGAKKNKYPSNLSEAIRKEADMSIKDYSDRIFSAMAFVLDTCGMKYLFRGKEIRHTKSRVQSYMEENYPDEYQNLRAKVSDWAISIINSNSTIDLKVYNDIKSYLDGEFQRVFGFNKTADEYLNFISDVNINLPCKEDDIQPTSKNVYIDEDGLNIEISTVHSVKGETHIATLYMETEYYGNCESKYLRDIFSGIPYTNRKENADKARHVAYVAMSRPRHLLCMAIERSNYISINSFELPNIWEIVSVQ